MSVVEVHPVPDPIRPTAMGPVARVGGGGRPPPRVSLEFGPPKTAEAEETLWQAIRRLEPLRPEFVSVTYGAGGSTRERTHRTVVRMLQETSLKPAAPLTCGEAPTSRTPTAPPTPPSW